MSFRSEKITILNKLTYYYWLGLMLAPWHYFTNENGSLLFESDVLLGWSEHKLSKRRAFSWFRKSLLLVGLDRTAFCLSSTKGGFGSLKRTSRFGLVARDAMRFVNSFSTFLLIQLVEWGNGWFLFVGRVGSGASLAVSELILDWAALLLEVISAQVEQVHGHVVFEGTQIFWQVDWVCSTW